MLIICPLQLTVNGVEKISSRATFCVCSFNYFFSVFIVMCLLCSRYSRNVPESLIRKFARNLVGATLQKCGNDHNIMNDEATYLHKVQLDWTSNTSRQKINLPANQKGYDKSETTDEKLSARRI